MLKLTGEDHHLPRQVMVFAITCPATIKPPLVSSHVLASNSQAPLFANHALPSSFQAPLFFNLDLPIRTEVIFRAQGTSLGPETLSP